MLKCFQGMMPMVRSTAVYNFIYIQMCNARFTLLSGLMCELLWSDPQPQPGRGPSKRGVGLSFGGDVTKRFLQENNLGMPLFLSHI